LDSDCRQRTSCRLCGSLVLSKALSFAPTPLANAFVTRDQLALEQPRYPLDLALCRACGHVQLLDVVDPRVLYEHYVYVSGTSSVFVRHFEEYAGYVRQRFSPPAGSLVVDIGSNDGTLLGFFQRAGHAVVGVEPALEISEASRRGGIPTITGFFTPELASRILAAQGPASVVTANNVMAHIDDLDAVVRGIERLLAPDGVFVFEVSYLVDVLEKTLFDTVYHEHLDYHSVEPLVPFFAARGLELIEAIRVDSHGGSLRGVVQRAGGPHPAGGSVEDAIAYERETGLRDERTFRAFGDHIGHLGARLLQLLRELKGAGRRIAGFGAPAKATTLLYQLGIEPGMIDFIVDDSPLKQGRYSPGMHIPVLPAQALYERRPDYVLLLAWNFAQPIMARHAAFQEAGGRFIVPLPALEVH
jgi:SAM-dependent methyltransferase